MSILIGQELNWLHAMPLPMPDEVVDRIHRLAQQQRTNPGLLFGDRNMNSVEMESVDSSDNEDDEDYIPDQEEHDEESKVEDDDTVQNYNDDENDYESVGNVSIDVNEENNVGPPTGTPGEGMPDENPGVEDNEIKGEERDDHDFAGLDVEYGENPGVADRENERVEQEGYDIYNVEVEDENQHNVSTENDKDEHMRVDQDGGEEEGAQSKPRYNLRKNRARSYTHMYNPELYETENKKHNELDDVVLTTVDDVLEETPQMSMKKGLKMFGEGGYAAVKKEMQQLHDRKVMQPVSRKDLSPEQKKEALGYFMFLKKKTVWNNPRPGLC